MKKQNKVQRNQQRALGIVRKAIENDSDILICTKENIVVNGNTITLIKLIGDVTRSIIDRTKGELNFAIALMIQDVLKYMKKGMKED